MICKTQEAGSGCSKKIECSMLSCDSLPKALNCSGSIAGLKRVLSRVSATEPEMAIGEVGVGTGSLTRILMQTANNVQDERQKEEWTEKLDDAVCGRALDRDPESFIYPPMY